MSGCERGGDGERARLVLTRARTANPDHGGLALRAAVAAGRAGAWADAHAHAADMCRLVDDGNTFDPRREPTRHLAFGHGMHRCVGAELARMELRISLRALAQRFPDLAVTAQRCDLDFRKLSAVYGVEGLPVHLYGADRAPATI